MAVVGWTNRAGRADYRHSNIRHGGQVLVRPRQVPGATATVRCCANTALLNPSQHLFIHSLSMKISAFVYRLNQSAAAAGFSEIIQGAGRSKCRYVFTIEGAMVWYDSVWSTCSHPCLLAATAYNSRFAGASWSGREGRKQGVWPWWRKVAIG